MSHDPAQKQQLDKARETLAGKRLASAQLLAAVAEKEAGWKSVARTAEGEAQAVKDAKAAYDQAVQALKTAREEERTAWDNVVDALTHWLDTDPAEDIKILSADFPMVLFPVRLETRFDPVGNPQVLKVRIYPDEIMADTHEPGLMRAEYDAGTAYWEAYWESASKPADRQQADDREAWRRLLQQFSAARAAWIVRETTPKNLNERGTAGRIPDFPQPEIRPQSWTRAAETRVLPDRWVVLAYRNGREVHRAVSAPVVEPLALTINPTASADGSENISAETLLQDPDVAWTFNFEQAEKVGMAIRIDLEPNDITSGFDRLIVVGVKVSLPAKAPATDKEAGDRRLAELLEAQHYTSGLAFVPQGTPTNNTNGGPAGFPPDDPGGGEQFRRRAARANHHPGVRWA